VEKRGKKRGEIGKKNVILRENWWI
jgi:hypothetical protein